MNHICTLSDINYLHYGICLYESLTENSTDDFTLHYLALDEKTKTKLLELNFSNLVVYTQEDLNSKDKTFQDLKKNNKSCPLENKKENMDIEDGHSPFHWMLSSFFSNFLLEHENLPHILYVDSDILFYSNIDFIFDNIKDKHVGLVSHKHIQLNKNEENPGYYNVGIIYFNNTELGRKCLDFWKYCCTYPENKYAKPFGCCGDQKYLELFEDVIGSENIDLLCLSVGNLAPWNLPMVTLLDTGRFIWKDPSGIVLKDKEIEQQLVFYHFSHFNSNFESLSYSMDRAGEWGPFIRSQHGVPDLYWNYFDKLINIRKKYDL